MSKEVEQCSNTVNSILKKQVYECASPTLEDANKMRRRISFSGKKSIKEFASGTDVATIWGPSYEVSADNLPQIHNDSSRRDLSKDFNIIIPKQSIKPSKKNYGKISPENDKENLIVTDNLEYSSIQLTNISLNSAEKSYLNKYSEPSTSCNITNLSNLETETQVTNLEHSYHFERTIKVQGNELSLLNTEKATDVTLKNIVETSKPVDKKVNVQYRLQKNDSNLDLDNSLNNLVKMTENYLNHKTSNPISNIINLDSDKFNRRTVNQTVNMDIIFSKPSKSGKIEEICNNCNSLEIIPDPPQYSNTKNKDVDLLEKDKILFSVKTGKKLDESVLNSPNMKKTEIEFEKPVDLSAHVHSSFDEELQTIPCQERPVVQMGALPSSTLIASKLKCLKTKNNKRKSIRHCVKMDLDRSLKINPANKIRKKNNQSCKINLPNTIDIEVDESIKQVENNININRDKGSEEPILSENIDRLDCNVNHKIKTTKLSHLLEDSLDENELKMKYSNLKFLRKPKTNFFNKDLSQMSTYKITPRENDLKKTDLEINKNIDNILQDDYKKSLIGVNATSENTLIPVAFDKTHDIEPNKIIDTVQDKIKKPTTEMKPASANIRRTIVFDQTHDIEIDKSIYDTLQDDIRKPIIGMKAASENTGTTMIFDKTHDIEPNKIIDTVPDKIKKPTTEIKPASANTRRTIVFDETHDIEIDKSIDEIWQDDIKKPIIAMKAASENTGATMIFVKTDSIEKNKNYESLQDEIKKHIIEMKPASTYTRRTIVFDKTHDIEIDKNIDKIWQDDIMEPIIAVKSTSENTGTTMIFDKTQSIEKNKNFESLQDGNKEPIIEMKIATSKNRRTIVFDQIHEKLDETNIPDQSKSIRSGQNNIPALHRSISINEKIQSCESSDDGCSQKSLLEFENTESTLKKQFQVRPNTPGKKNALFFKQIFNNDLCDESTENSTILAEVPMEIEEDREISSSISNISDMLFDSSTRYEPKHVNKSETNNAQSKHVIFNLNNTTSSIAVNVNKTNINVSSQENCTINQQIELDKKSSHSFDFDFGIRDTNSSKSCSIQIYDENHEPTFKQNIKFKDDNSEQKVLVQHENVEIFMEKSPKKLQKIQNSVQLPILATSVLLNAKKSESFTNSPQNSSNTDESLFLFNTSLKDGLTSYEKKYMHLTTNIDDIDEFELSLVSNLSESVALCNEIVESENFKDEINVPRENVDNFGTTSARDNKLQNVCSRCKTCRRSLPALNETDITEKVESKYATIDWSVLDKYKNQPTISEVWNNFKVRLENLSNENDDNISNEPLSLSGVDNVTKLMEKLLKNKLEQIKSLSISAIFPRSLSFDRLLINKYEDEDQCYPWMLNARYLCDNYFIFRHRKVKSFRLVILKEKTRAVDQDAKFKKILFENEDFLLGFQPEFDRLINREILKIIPIDLAQLYPTSNLLTKCLNDLNDVAVPIHELVFDLLDALNMQDATLEEDETTGIYYIQKIHRVKNETGLIDRFEFHIIVDDINQISYKDITLPSIIYFKKSIEGLPVGIKFIEEFLNDPMKFLTSRDPGIYEK